MAQAFRKERLTFIETTRIEDRAYCLLGLFDVNMPLLYGEGEKAFIRLQEEIVKDSDDESIFAWRADFSYGAYGKPCGLLAPSPAAFLKSGDILFPRHNFENPPWTITNKGFRLTLPLVGWRQRLLLKPPHLETPSYMSLSGVSPDNIWIALLNCCERPQFYDGFVEEEERPAIWLIWINYGKDFNSYARVFPQHFVPRDIVQDLAKKAKDETFYIRRKGSRITA